ncbi:MAG: twin-arginine translocase TatA/TatE family subunit [Bacteroidota bacterium]
MPNLGVSEIVLILLVVLIFFGAKKIPELAQGLGKGLREFRKATREVQEDIENEARKLDDNHAKRDSSPKPKS